MTPTLRPLPARYPWAADILADILADADLAAELTAREHYYLLDGATLAQEAGR